MLIAIEGCLGAGKTTVARGLAAYRGSYSLLEAFELNPFLRAFYEDPTGTALETEFAFLLLHYHQLRIHGGDGSGREVVADFHLGKDLIYADLNFRDQRVRRLFDDLYAVCQEVVAVPDILVCLSISTELVLDRIRRRNRDFELVIDTTYYTALNEAYERFFESYRGRKLRVPMDSWDFEMDPALYKALALQIDKQLGVSR